MRRRQKGQKKARRPNGSLSTADEGRLVNLSPRQREIALLVGGGGRNKEVAAKLNISEKTVKAHLTAVFIKLGLYDRVGLMHFVAKHLMNGPQTASP